MEVDGSPRSAASSPHHDQTGREHEFFANVKQVKAAPVNLLHWVHILPGNYDEEIQKQPPGEQQCEIEGSDAYRMIVPLNVRLNGDGGHHWDDMQEKNYVSDKWVGSLMTKIDLDIGPHQL